jgi:hypothetical protein
MKEDFNPASGLPPARACRLHRGGRAVLPGDLALYGAARPALLVALPRWHPTLTESWRAHKWEQLQRLRARAIAAVCPVLDGLREPDSATHPAAMAAAALS